MLFDDGTSSVNLSIIRYEFPDGEGVSDGADRNWLLLRCTWKREDGEIRQDSGCYLMTFELQELTAGLKVLRAGIKSSYTCDFVEPYFTLNARAEGEDAFFIEVSFLLQNSMDGDDRAEIACTMDNAALKNIIEELDAACRRFPPRM